jgi:hypothetical protein
MLSPLESTDGARGIPVTTLKLKLLRSDDIGEAFKDASLTHVDKPSAELSLLLAAVSRIELRPLLNDDRGEKSLTDSDAGRISYSWNSSGPGT